MGEKVPVKIIALGNPYGIVPDTVSALRKSKSDALCRWN